MTAALCGSRSRRQAFPAGCLRGAQRSIALAQLSGDSSLGAGLEVLRDRTVLVAARDQLTAAVALLELDGVAHRMVLCTPDLAAEHFAGIAAAAGADACVVDAGSVAAASAGMRHIVRASADLCRLSPRAPAPVPPSGYF